jgi:hypothetical protein
LNKIDDEMCIIQQENAINPVIVEGKRVFGFDIGDVLRIEYICDEPPLGCAWAALMKEQAYKNKFIAQVVKLVSPTTSLTRRTIFKIHNKFVKFQSACIFKLLYILILKVKTKEEEGAVADAGGELL